MLEFMKLGFKQVAFGGADDGGGGGGESDSAPTSSTRPTQRPTQRPSTVTAPSGGGPSNAERNRQALLESQMQQEQRGRAAQEAAAVAADRQRQAATQAEANRQAQASRIEADRQRQAATQAEANRQYLQQQVLARQMENQQQQEDAPRQTAGIETLASPPPSLPRTGITTVNVGTIAAPTGVLTPAQAAAQAAGIQEQRQAYQDMLARAQAAQAARQETVPFTPVPVDFIPSIDLRDQSGSLLPPERGSTNTVSIGYGPGQVDPTLARAADVQEGQPAFGQTTGPSTIEDLYGLESIFDIRPTPTNLADVMIAMNMFDDTQQLMQSRPDLVLPPLAMPTVVPTGQVPAGTPGAQAPRDIYEMDEVQLLLDASPSARTVFQDLGITRRLRVSTPSDPTSGQFIYRDAAGNELSAQQVADTLRSAPTTTLPGGYLPIAPLDVTTPTVPALDLGLTPVDVAIPITMAPGGGGGAPGGGMPVSQPVSQPVLPTPPGIETLMDRSPTLGRPASTTVPQAADIVMPATDTAVTPSSPPDLVPPEEEVAPTVDISVPEAKEEVAPTVDISVPEAEEGPTVDVEVPEPAPTQEELVQQGWGWDRNEDGKISLSERLGDMLDGGGKGQSGDQFEGGGVLSAIGNFLGGPGTGTGTGAGAGDGAGDGSGADEEMTDVVVEDTSDEQQPSVVEEEPAFECPPGFRLVQMPNGGFTCVPDMERPRVGPYTQPVSVAPLAGRTPFSPGTRRT